MTDWGVHLWIMDCYEVAGTKSVAPALGGCFAH